MAKINIGNIFHDEGSSTPLKSASTDFEVFNEDTLEMSKVTDRIDSYYFSGDFITFTITIKNTGSKKTVNLVFRDTIDPVVTPESGTEFTVTTTIGTIVSRTSNIVITHITLNPNETCTITITGKIA